MYYKGANMLHTLRQLVGDDNLWREVLRGLNKEFYHKTVTTEEIENYISQKTKKDLSAFFNQYLRTTNIPKLEYKIDGNSITYNYVNALNDFDMPVKVFIGDKEIWLFPLKNGEKKTENLEGDLTTFRIDLNFYIRIKGN